MTVLGRRLGRWAVLIKMKVQTRGDEGEPWLVRGVGNFRRLDRTIRRLCLNCRDESICPLSALEALARNPAILAAEIAE